MPKKKAKLDRSAMKQQLKKRMEESQKKDSSRRLGFFKPNREVSFWKCDEGEHMIDIIPYAAGKNDPSLAEGEYAYVLEIYAHFSVGPDEDKSYICMEKTYGPKKHKCPICEHRRQLQADGANDETLKALDPKRRCVYNVVCYDDSKQEDKGVQVWHVAQYFSEYHFKRLMVKPERGRSKNKAQDPYIYFMDAEEGKSIAFTKEGKGVTTKVLGHRFVDRDYEIDDDTLDEAHKLDELIHLPTYEELYEAYWGESIDDAEDEVNEEDETEEVEEEVVKEKPKRTKRKAKKVEPAPEEEEEEDEEVEEEESEEDEESENEEEEEDADDENEESEGGDDCSGYGVDVDKLEACDDCEVWEQCFEEKEKRDEEAKKKNTKESTPKTKRRRTR